MDGSHVNEETVTHLRQRLNVMREIVKVISPLLDDGWCVRLVVVVLVGVDAAVIVTVGPGSTAMPGYRGIFTYFSSPPLPVAFLGVKYINIKFLPRLYI